MTGEKDAPDHNKMVAAPAEMPGVEETARAIATRITDAILDHVYVDGENVSASVLHPASDIIAGIIAPILAEKQAHIDNLADLLIETQTKAMDAVAETEARALAAEAALEPFAKYHEPSEFLDDKGQPLPDETHAGYVYLTLGDFRRAAAIRAQGE